MELVILIVVLLFFSDTIREMRENRKYTDVSHLIHIEHDRVPPEEYEAYRAYLLTEEWKALRFDTFFRDSFHCTRCNTTSHLQCHHTHYRGIETMTFTLDQLETVCKTCHESIHLGELPMESETHKT